MWVALTGTPGVGKSTLAAELARRGRRVVAVNDLAREKGLLTERDEARGSFVVDERALAQHVAALWSPDPPGFLEGHFAHELPVDAIVLLRLDPAELLVRLRARGWPEAKVRENVEAEALDVVAGEVVEIGVPSAEVDATGKSAVALADEVVAIVEDLARGLKSHPVGSVAWSLESLPWF